VMGMDEANTEYIHIPIRTEMDFIHVSKFQKESVVTPPSMQDPFQLKGYQQNILGASCSHHTVSIETYIKRNLRISLVQKMHGHYLDLGADQYVGDGPLPQKTFDLLAMPDEIVL
ncbi:hypothetical protein Taro_039756, partial [Colocasia esculenta]|nr:hypothetical protein [Colocasia esculenta]